MGKIKKMFKPPKLNMAKLEPEPVRMPGQQDLVAEQEAARRKLMQRSSKAGRESTRLQGRGDYGRSTILGA